MCCANSIVTPTSYLNVYESTVRSYTPHLSSTIQLNIVSCSGREVSSYNTDICAYYCIWTHWIENINQPQGKPTRQPKYGVVSDWWNPGEGSTTQSEGEKTSAWDVHSAPSLLRPWNVCLRMSTEAQGFWWARQCWQRTVERKPHGQVHAAFSYPPYSLRRETTGALSYLPICYVSNTTVISLRRRRTPVVHTKIPHLWHG